jgi:hypothetical protein
MRVCGFEKRFSSLWRTWNFGKQALQYKVCYDASFLEFQKFGRYMTKLTASPITGTAVTQFQNALEFVTALIGLNVADSVATEIVSN